MTDPEFTDPKRWQQPKDTGDPEGTYQKGITNVKILLKYARVMSIWTHIEEKMIELIDLLVFVDHDIRMAVKDKTRGHLPGRQIFRSISANGVRARVMNNLLHRFIGNIKKDPLYDEVIADFQRLVDSWNKWHHGLWWTHESGKVYIQSEDINEFAFLAKKEITEDDFDSFLHRAATVSGT